ncbi:Orn/Lys/Arg decarboxylase N-terminal domain-containing protein [Streptomyces mutabilis]|uniref:Orn/Lys/Arg decarboxylase N-terminal domain-containing protein n=1 Tax=Streptomyces mutabilis TaxID=67332 RepID=UPI00406BC899
MTDGIVMVAVAEHPEGAGAAGQLARVADGLRTSGLQVRWVRSVSEAEAVLRTEAGLAAAVVAWELPPAADDSPGGATVLRRIGRRFQNLPVFLVMEDEGLRELPLWVSQSVVGYVWPLEDTPAFIAGRITTAARAYQDALLPPFFKALRRFDDAHEYSWHTPAHSGGVAFLKSPVNRAFHDYFGERLLRSDLSISVEELGSLFEHTGPIGEAERNAARIFGSDQTYFVLHGDSTCNRLVGHFSVTRDEIALVDRNCHKSVLHGLVVSGARPVYLVPTRNGYGLAGPLPPAEIASDSVAARIAQSPLTADAVSARAQYAVFTNSTYDGLCYDAVTAARAFAASTPRLHFDEAWFAYARFHPLYKGRYGMSVDAEVFPGPPIGRRCSRPSRRTSCWRRCPREPWCTCGRRRGRRWTTTGSTRR